VKLLLDENLPAALTSALDDVFPGSTHVLTLGFGQTPDIEVYRYAAKHGFTILTKDSDYDALSGRHGAPPKVILLKIGNMLADDLWQFVRVRRTDFAAFISSADDERILRVKSRQ
jgi:predicted nuclease of predicted toxin-antitoxin system